MISYKNGVIGEGKIMNNLTAIVKNNFQSNESKIFQGYKFNINVFKNLRFRSRQK